jgi:hypothetical protein
MMRALEGDRMTLGKLLALGLLVLFVGICSGCPQKTDGGDKGAPAASAERAVRSHARASTRANADKHDDKADEDDEDEEDDKDRRKDEGGW